jgi:ATP/maltotriose-dependent transcriptional regulator MalT
VVFTAWRGRADEARAMMEVKMREASTRGEGIGIATAEYARAVLCNGGGNFEQALDAARVACADPREFVVHNWGLSELVESATRVGRADLAAEGLRRLTAKARASGTEWALGMEARARGLVSEGDPAETAFLESIEHLGRARVRAQLARSHLLYGEWLREVDRRLDARTELSRAYELFTDMGLEGFAERARRELGLTGVTVRTAHQPAAGDLTPQEFHIARLACAGMSNPEIGAQLFISARTVEWHLRKVFTKLGVRSRRELGGALADRDHAVGGQ